uniref:Calpain catalytic domain-containing protein n=1 Tax=Strigamia maritima TaxID=126957 RepID=T1IP60_STRMM
MEKHNQPHYLPQVRRYRNMRKILMALAPLLIITIMLYSWIINQNISCLMEPKRDWNDFDMAGRGHLDPLLIEYLRSKILIKPNSLPYDLNDPFVLDPTSIELTNLSNRIFKNKRNGIFFEAGAYHPESHSMTIFLERFLGWTGLLVEPNPVQFSTLLRSNRKSFFMQACLSPKNQSQKMVLTSEGMQSKLGEKKSSSSFEVECFPIYSILLAANFTKIDYFVLDVEGFELPVLKTIPFQSVDIDVFAVEHYNNKKPEELKDFMEDAPKQHNFCLPLVVYECSMQMSPHLCGRSNRYAMSGLEPVVVASSTFERQRIKCLQAGMLFDDPDFPTTSKSIYYTRRFSFFPTSTHKWMRPKDICKYYYTEPRFYLDGGSRFDLIQGELGDCWVVAAAACLSEDRHLLERVVPSGQSFNANWYAGIFRFRFWQYGEWVEVVIDDKLPTIGGKLVFVHSNHENEFWGALLEKAYAKLHGSYEALRAGTNSDALTDFTGGLVEQYLLSEPPPNLSRLFTKAFERRSLVGAAIYGDYSRNTELASGLVTGHAYSVTDKKEVSVNGRKFDLIRVRNPWGSHVEWKGAWSDNSEEWKLLPYDDRRRMGMVNRDDGEFWMEFRDFVRNFHAVEICNLTADALVDPPKTWSTSIVHGQWVKDHSAGGRLRYDTFWKNPQIRLRVEDHDEDADDQASFVVELLQKDRRSSKQLGLENLTIGFVIYAVLPSTPMPLTRNYFYYNQPTGEVNSYINARAVVQRFTLKPGEYIIVPTTWSPNEEAEFTIRVFSEAKHSTNSIADPEDNAIPSSTDGNANGTSNSEVDVTTQSLKKYFDNLAGPV